ncbi:hypothetical protein F4778DRAFT_441784 [Xylariomycetidae sp. FL2044]|nr:hypothetical protein F4778DRAFT_441784 [Xylariomycetidae sp. FL2044]
MDSAGAKSNLSPDMQHINSSPEDISNAVRGHKANLSNPRTSEESKEKSRKAIKDLGGDAAHYSKGDEGGRPGGGRGMQAANPSKRAPASS